MSNPAAQNPAANPYAAGAKLAAPTRVDPVAPLYHVKGWLKLIGWVNIVVGAIYCLTIIYAIIGWLPVWIGILCNKASANLEAGYQNRNSAQLQEATSNIATIIKIVGVLTVINLVMIGLAIVIVLVLLVGGGIASMQ